MTSKLTRERIEWLNYAATGLAANGTEMAMSPQDVIALTECCLAAMDSEPVAFIDKQWTLVYYVPPMNMGLQIGDKLYRHAQQPVVPATLPCSVELKPGLIIGKGCKTETLLTALRRRADYNAGIDAMTPEERAEYDANIEAFKAMLPQPAPVVPECAIHRDANRYRFLRDKDAFGDENALGLVSWDDLSELNLGEFDAAVDARINDSGIALYNIERLPTEEADADIYAELYRLRSEIKGPDGFDTWRDAAIAEKKARVELERQINQSGRDIDYLGAMAAFHSDKWHKMDPITGYMHGWNARRNHAQQPVVDIMPMQMFGIGSIFKPQVISDQEADCDDCAHYNPKICHGEGCPAISQQSPQPAPVVSEDLYKLANHIASCKNGLPDEWQDWAEELEADIRRAAMLHTGNSPVIPDTWIPVSERMPEDGQHIIIFCDDAFVLSAQYRDGEFFDVVRDGDEFFETTSRCVTHWMPLPAAPQEVR